MEAKIVPSLRCSWIESEKTVWSSGSSVQFRRRCGERQRLQMLTVGHLQYKRTANSHRPVHSEVSCSFQSASASHFESQNVKASFDNASILKIKSQEIMPYLNGRSIYLVGMMGCGKTTVGKILSEVLSYSFVDSDMLVEQTLGEISVAEIFKLYGEDFFRDKESHVLWDLSFRHQLVVSTGGGAVIRSINWDYMRKGISVWLDVPLKALAQRLANVGTDSRPLLQNGSGDVLEKTYGRLSGLWEERSGAYANANARVSLERIAGIYGQRDILMLTPALIALEVLEQIKGYLSGEDRGGFLEL